MGSRIEGVSTAMALLAAMLPGGCDCGGAGQGEPCTEQGDCRSDLVCDPVFMTCQVPSTIDSSVSFDTGVGTDSGTDSSLPESGSPDSTSPDSGPSDSGPGDGGAGAGLDYVTNTMNLPDTFIVGCDVDGNGTIDNSLGSLLAFLPGITGLASLDAQMAIDAAIADGSLLLLWRLVGPPNLVIEPMLDVVTVHGMDADANLMNNFTGSGVFDIAAGATPSVLPGAIGSIASGVLSAGPGTMPFMIPLGVGLTPLTVTLTQVCVVADVLASGWTSGELGGAISATEVTTVVSPAIAQAMNDLVAAEAIGGMVPCMSDNTTIGDHTSAACSAIDPNGVCSASNGVDTGICVDGTASIIMVMLADSSDLDGDGILSMTELDPILSLILVPDLDLNGDGTNESLSFGVSFTTVSATINGL